MDESLTASQEGIFDDAWHGQTVGDVLAAAAQNVSGRNLFCVYSSLGWVDATYTACQAGQH